MSRETDLLLETQEATSSVLSESSMPGCSVIFATDGAAHFTTLIKNFENPGMQSSSVGVFDTSEKDPGNNTVSQLSMILADVKQIRTSSRCTTLVVATDNQDLLQELVEGVLNENILTWPARLLLVTRLPRQRLRQLRRVLSVINAMVVIPEEAPHGKRCGIYLYLPVSHRSVQAASWLPDGGLTFNRMHRLFPDKFSKFTDGANFVVAGLNYPPHLKVQKLPSGDSGVGRFAFSGPVITLMDMLASHVNFTYRISQPTTGAWGVVFPNGTWNGMIGMVVRKEVDFALGPFARTYIRSTVVDYTNPLLMVYAKIIGRRGNTEVDPWSFVMPLAPMVWAATFATLGAILGIIYVVSEATTGSMPFSPRISLGTYIRAFLQQNIDVNSDNGWEKMVLGGWMLTVLVLLEAYSTNLISLLAVRHIAEPYHSMRDVMDDSSVKMLWFANTAYMQFLAAADSGIFQEVYRSLDTGKIRLIYPSEYVRIVDDLVSRGDHVLIHPYLSMKLFLTEDYMEDGNCKFYVSKEAMMPLAFGPIVPKYSPLKVTINKGIRAAVEGGLYDHWLDSTMTNPKSCKNPPTKMTVKASLSLTNIWGMFVALVGGYILSFFALFLEIVSVRRHSLNGKSS